MKKSDNGLKIGDLASMFGLTARTIRYYEELGLLKSNDRTEGIHRRYPEKNIVYLNRIKYLKDYGLSLGEIKEFFDLAEKDRSGTACKELLLAKYQEKIAEEESNLEKIHIRLASLREQVAALKSLEHFFSCPGDSCEACEFSMFCDDPEDEAP